METYKEGRSALLWIQDVIAEASGAERSALRAIERVGEGKEREVGKPRG